MKPATIVSSAHTPYAGEKPSSDFKIESAFFIFARQPRMRMTSSYNLLWSITITFDTPIVHTRCDKAGTANHLDFVSVHHK